MKEYPTKIRIKKYNHDQFGTVTVIEYRDEGALYFVYSDIRSHCTKAYSGKLRTEKLNSSVVSGETDLDVTLGYFLEAPDVDVLLIPVDDVYDMDPDDDFFEWLLEGVLVYYPFRFKPVQPIEENMIENFRILVGMIESAKIAWDKLMSENLALTMTDELRRINEDHIS